MGKKLNLGGGGVQGRENDNPIPFIPFFFATDLKRGK